MEKEHLLVLASEVVLEWYLERCCAISLYDLVTEINKWRSSSAFITMEDLTAFALPYGALRFPDCDGELLQPFEDHVIWPTWSPTKDALRDHIQGLREKLGPHC